MRFVVTDLFVIINGTLGVWWYFTHRVRKQKKAAMVEATFVGGPLDNQKKMVHPTAVYQYKDHTKMGPNMVAVYKHVGVNIYDFDEYVEDNR